MTNTIIYDYDYSGRPSRRIIALADSIEGLDVTEVVIPVDDIALLKEDFTFRNSEGEVIEL